MATISCHTCTWTHSLQHFLRRRLGLDSRRLDQALFPGLAAWNRHGLCHLHSCGGQTFAASSRPRISRLLQGCHCLVVLLVNYFKPRALTDLATERITGNNRQDQYCARGLANGDSRITATPSFIMDNTEDPCLFRASR